MPWRRGVASLLLPPGGSRQAYHILGLAAGLEGPGQVQGRMAQRRE